MNTHAAARLAALSPQGRQHLQAVLHPPPALLVFDFDGTLAPIVAQPDAARAPLAVARALEALMQHHVVAIVTGRAVDDVAGRLGFVPHHVLGSHGAEDPADVQSAERIAHHRSALDELRAACDGSWAASLGDAGVQVEDKGLSLAFHYRLSRDRQHALSVVRGLLAEHGGGLRTFDGKCVVNAMADEAPDKADAVETLVARTGISRVVFAGDDVNDEPVFERRRPGWFTVKVGGDPRQSAAEFHLGGTAEMALFLAACLRCSR
ncbi:trehalose-phosphatase [Aquabacterium fontiphilum]|uniref:trehalose-phosphatase n=1 Tax=Aquabacterium fontiphilum TaxID=450365 RepID=UPI0013776CF4|nr:trehalose-phosphatase [Aquabacterium fontiphilum]NBD21330.1 trehalose-phosphatase [Aquabacterium fontiphilum]